MPVYPWGILLELSEGTEERLVVVGIVEFPWAWFSKCSGLRVRHSRTSAVVFAPKEWVEEKLGASSGEFFWIEGKEETLCSFQEELRLAARRRIRSIPVEWRTRCTSGGTRWESPINRDYIQLASTTELNSLLNRRSSHVISKMTQLPIVIMVLSIFAITCTMAASVRSREKEFQIMRACGFTRAQMVRLVLAEAFLNGLGGILLGISLGIFHGSLSIRLAGIAPVFGMNAPSLLIPWQNLAMGSAMALLLALAGSIPTLKVHGHTRQYH